MANVNFSPNILSMVKHFNPFYRNDAAAGTLDAADGG